MLTRPQKIGHILGVLLAVLSMVPVGGLGSHDDDGEVTGPPLAVVVISVVLGIAVVVLLVWSWRTGRRGPRRVADVLMAVSALTALPALGQSGVSDGIKLAAGIGILLTAAAIVLLFYPRRTAALS